MAAKKVIFFTAGDIPTTQEKADIATLNALAAAPFEVVVRSKNGNHSFGTGIEAADYKAGDPPSSYSGVTALTGQSGTALFPATGLPSDCAIVRNGQKRSGVTGAGANNVGTLAVSNGVLTGIACATS